MKNKWLPRILLLLLLTSVSMNEFNAETPNPLNINNDPVIQLPETAIEKIHDRSFMEYVNQAQSTGTRENQIFKVFIKYESGQKGLIQEIIKQQDVENVYFYRYTNLISIQAEAGILAALLSEKAILSLESDKINKASGVCN